MGGSVRVSCHLTLTNGDTQRRWSSNLKVVHHCFTTSYYVAMYWSEIATSLEWVWSWCETLDNLLHKLIRSCHHLFLFVCCCHVGTAGVV